MSDDERDAGDAAADQSTEPVAESTQPAEPGQTPSEAEAWVVPPEPPAPNPELIPAHPVPATPLSEGTICPRCGTDNRPGIAFCRACGQRLMAPGAPAAVERPSPPEGAQACPRCGTHNRAGVPFCQNCGANLRPADAANFLGMSSSTLAKMRMRGDGPPYAKLGKRIVLYDLIDLENWIATRKRASTSEYSRDAGAQ